MQEIWYHFSLSKSLDIKKGIKKQVNHIGIIIGSMVSEYLGFLYTTFTIILIKIETHFLVKSYVLEICNISFIVFCYCIVHMGNIFFYYYSNQKTKGWSRDHTTYCFPTATFVIFDTGTSCTMFSPKFVWNDMCWVSFPP